MNGVVNEVRLYIDLNLCCFCPVITMNSVTALNGFLTTRLAFLNSRTGFSACGPGDSDEHRELCCLRLSDLWLRGGNSRLLVSIGGFFFTRLLDIIAMFETARLGSGLADRFFVAFALVNSGR
jgi:hypothetical protein